MKSVLKSDGKGGVIVSDECISKQNACSRCGESLSEKNPSLYEEYGYKVNVIKGAGCGACVQTGKNKTKGVV